jgi:hypothetical protein
MTEEGSLSDVFIVRAGIEGNLLWAKTWGTNAYEIANKAAMGPDGNVYICGYWVVWGGEPDVLLAKLDADGNLVWAKTWGGTAAERAYGLAVAGNAVYLVGYTESFGAGGEDVLLQKYDASGNVLWSRAWGGIDDEGASAICLDKQGNIYVAGGTYSFGAGHRDALILKYNAEGTLLGCLTWGTANLDGFGSIGFNNDTKQLYTAGVSGDFLGRRGILALWDADLKLGYIHAWGGEKAVASFYTVLDETGNAYCHGTAENNQGAWQEASGVRDRPEGIVGEAEGTVSDIALIEGTPEWVVTNPEGITDTGGGGDDVLLLKNFE